MGARWEGSPSERPTPAKVRFYRQPAFWIALPAAIVDGWVRWRW